MEKQKQTRSVNSKNKRTEKVTPYNFEFLTRILSPLELVARAFNYKPFTYRIGNKVYLINESDAQLLKANAASKLKMLQGINPMPLREPTTKKEQASISYISKPVNRLPLSKALKEKLKANAILFFSDIVYMGLVDFSKAKQITKTDVNAIIRLCAKKNWATVFLRTKQTY
jgi:hypothetical protein